MQWTSRYSLPPYIRASFYESISSSRSLTKGKILLQAAGEGRSVFSTPGPCSWQHAGVVPTPKLPFGHHPPTLLRLQQELGILSLPSHPAPRDRRVKCSTGPKARRAHSLGAENETRGPPQYVAPSLLEVALSLQPCAHGKL